VRGQREPIDDALAIGAPDRRVAAADPRLGHHMDKLRRTHAFQPILTDIRSIAPSGWYGTPEGATVERGKAMVKNIVAVGALQAVTEIFPKETFLTAIRLALKATVKTR